MPAAPGQDKMPRDKYKGYSVNSTDPQHLKEARELLRGAKRRSQGFASGVEGKNRVLGKGVRLAMA